MVILQSEMLVVMMPWYHHLDTASLGWDMMQRRENYQLLLETIWLLSSDAKRTRIDGHSSIVNSYRVWEVGWLLMDRVRWSERLAPPSIRDNGGNQAQFSVEEHRLDSSGDKFVKHLLCSIVPFIVPFTLLYCPKLPIILLYCPLRCARIKYLPI